MNGHRRDKRIPRYQGSDWLKVKLPTQAMPWLEGKHQSLRMCRSSHATASAELTALLERDRWKWPRQPIYFFADPHADADAMLASLVASGGIKKTGPRDNPKTANAGVACTLQNAGLTSSCRWSVRNYPIKLCTEK
ncbi:MAG: hypothetical protein U9P00_01395, partial [Pseudomonadota bacterium]|nr:hypothetical protein [Pseudomonadota bacterium]